MEDKNVMNVMLGGQFPKELPESNLWCGVDKGALYLIDNGIKPHIVVVILILLIMSK